MIRYALMNDLDKGLFELYKKGFLMHYNARPDYFPVQTDEELRSNMVEMMKNPDEFILVYEEENTIKGFLAYQIRDKRYKTIWVDELYVNSDSRQIGIGKKLMAEVKRISIQNNCKSVELNCWCFNENAIMFYEKIGFKRQRIIFEDVN